MTAAGVYDDPDAARAAQDHDAETPDPAGPDFPAGPATPSPQLAAQLDAAFAHLDAALEHITTLLAIAGPRAACYADRLRTQREYLGLLLRTTETPGWASVPRTPGAYPGTNPPPGGLT